MNVLKRIIIPKIEFTIRYILSELEELEREDTFRLKRVKQNNMKKAKQDGAGEQVEIDVAKIKKEEKESVVAENEDVQNIQEEVMKSKESVEEVPEKSKKDYKEYNTVDNESKTVQPKEAAAMGDLIIIKPTEDGLELVDALVSETDLKEIAYITETKELTNSVIEVESNKDNIEKLSEDIISETVVEDQCNDDVNADLEAGEWFETANRIVDDKPSEYSKMDKFEDVLGTQRISDDVDSIPDIDKRGTASLYRDIDSNFYKPTIDDIFSKHSIAMDDSNASSHSLVDLESLDFSIDSKGKVVYSRRDTESSPALSYREVDTKQPVTYNEKGILIPKSSSSNLRWQDDIQTDNAPNEIEDNVDHNVESNEPNASGNNKTKNKRELTVSDSKENRKIDTTDELIPTINVDESESKLTVSQDLDKKDLKFNIFDENLENHSTTEIREENINSGTETTLDKHQENLKTVTSARSSRDLHKIKDKHNIEKDKGINRLNQELTLTLNPIAEENEVELAIIHDPDQQISDNADVNNDSENEKTISGTAKINNQKFKEQGSRHIDKEIKSKRDHQNETENDTRSIKIERSEKDEDVSDKETKPLQNKISEERERVKKSDKESQNKQLFLKTSDEIKEDEGSHIADIKEDQTEETEAEDEKKKETEDDEGFDEVSTSTDKPERHNRDDHLKQD